MQETKSEFDNMSPEEIKKIKDREYREKNREKRLQYMREYRKNNKHKIKEYNKKYYHDEANIENCKKYNREYNKKYNIKRKAGLSFQQIQEFGHETSLQYLGAMRQLKKLIDMNPSAFKLLIENVAAPMDVDTPHKDI